MASLNYSGSAIILAMRINLATPFSEKDAVKALGARWDAAKKVWYISDVADVTPFMRWIPDRDLEAATEKSKGSAGKALGNTAGAPIRRSEGVNTTSVVAVVGCDCKVLPWEDCEHTLAEASSR
jgi:hypothetical protein